MSKDTWICEQVGISWNRAWNCAAARSAPLMQRLVRGSKLRIGPAVDDYRRLASRRRYASDMTLPDEGPDHLDAKIDRDDYRTFVMIEKDVVAVSVRRPGCLPRKAHTLSTAGLNSVGISLIATRWRTAAKMREDSVWTATLYVTTSPRCRGGHFRHLRWAKMKGRSFTCGH